MYRKTFFRLILVITLIMLLAPPALAQGDWAGRAISNLNVRNGPGEAYSSLAQIPRGTTILISGRSRVGDWLLVRTQDRVIRGWVASRYVALDEGITLDMLPIMDEGIMSPGQSSGEDTLAYAASAPVEEIIAMLEAAPVLPAISTRAWEIYRFGQGRGLQTQVFSKVGDCMTDDESFLAPIGLGDYDLGPYANLQETIDFFSVSPRPEVGVANSFVNDSMAAFSGFSALSVLDPTWADVRQCQPGEGSLACEYRLTRPSVAIILFGAVDLQQLTLEQFDHYLNRVVRETIDAGVVPILSTFPSSPNYQWEPSLRFNAVIFEIAQTEQIPLVNLWRASRPLPNYGLGPDNHRLSYSGTRTVSFNGDEALWGYTLRNLLTLQVLDQVRQDILAH